MLSIRIFISHVKPFYDFILQTSTINDLHETKLHNSSNAKILFQYLYLIFGMKIECILISCIDAMLFRNLATLHVILFGCYFFLIFTISNYACSIYVIYLMNLLMKMPNTVAMLNGVFWVVILFAWDLLRAVVSA